MNLAALLTERPVVLLDFDGPMCAVFGGTLSAPEVARRLTQAARGQGVQLGADLDGVDDPFDVLKAAAQNGPDDATCVEALLRMEEVRAVSTAPIADGLHAALAALRDSGHGSTVVSNNSTAAVHAFITSHGLHDLIRGVIARTEPDPALLKPSPHLVRQAVADNRARPEQCVLIGDSDTDIIAAHHAGVAAVAYANKPGKLGALQAQHPEAVITHLDDITRASKLPYVS
ncbi:MAG: HAD family hydrolase [Pseudonocardia sp.]|mgnify:FL=1|uniref:HAD family hydrolase n=1 Tax=Pseudonocardia sp. TaxID=60912 RepID=UPI001AC8A38E|nr:HAD hydrolase-like protein [Pseudonocardia sp.]MBN9098862.1 HAD family hydrolase [Pseudonocardia sp.]